MRGYRVGLLAALIIGLGIPARAQALGETAEPQVFFYFAVWDSDSDTFIKSTLQRIQRSYSQYTQLKDEFVQAFKEGVQQTPTDLGAGGLAAAAAKTPTPATGNQTGNQAGSGTGTEAAARNLVEIRMTLDKDISKDQAPLVLAFDLEPVQTALQAGNDLNALAEWSFYYWQLSLWEWYISRETLLQPDYLTVTDLAEMERKAKLERAPVWTWTEIDSKDNEPKEWIQLPAEFRDMPAAEPGADENMQLIRQLAENQYNGQIHSLQDPTSWAQEWQGLYRAYEVAAYSLDADEHDRYFSIFQRLRDRQESRDRYYSWLQDRHDLVVDWAKSWARKYDGTELNIDGIQYLVSPRQSPEELTAGPATRLLVIDQEVTPYDLLNEDGSLKRPLPVED